MPDIYTVFKSSLTAVANAIRAKSGQSGTLVFPSEFVSAISNLPTGEAPTGTKQISISENGTTTEDVANYANAEITVNVPTGVTPTGTKQISISANGTTIEDVASYANAEITVNVPTSGGGSDLSAVDVFVGDYLSTTDLIITVGAVNRYQRYLVGN